MKKLTFLLIPILLFSCAGKSGNSMSNEKKKSLYEVIQPVIAQIREGAARADSKQMLEVFSATEDFQFIATSGEVLTYPAFKEMITQFYRTITGEMLSKGAEKYTYIDENSFLWTYAGAVTVVFKNGKKIKYDPFGATFLFKKINDQWKAIFLQESGQESPQVVTARTK